MNIFDVKNYIKNTDISSNELEELKKVIIDKLNKKNNVELRFEKSFSPSPQKCPTCGK